MLTQRTQGYQIQLSQIIYTLSFVISLFLRFLVSVQITDCQKVDFELSQFLEQLKPKLLLPLLYLENSGMC